MDRLVGWLVGDRATENHLSALRAVERFHLDGFDLRKAWGSGCMILARVHFMVRCDSHEGRFLGNHLKCVVREDALVGRRWQCL